MSSKTVLETLEAARKLITPPRAWTQGVGARNAEGKDVISTSPDAVCWCAYGAIWRVVNSDDRSAAEEALEAVVEDGDVIRFNDSQTHPAVLRAFDAAIAKEREAQHVL